MRIPVLFGGVAPGDAASAPNAYLVEDGAAMPPDVYAMRFALPAGKFAAGSAAGAGHLPGCTCCTPRGPAADALTRMFRARSTGSAPFFRQVIVLASPAGEATVRHALEQDIVTKARYVPAN
jgi:hypothetical protein